MLTAKEARELHNIKDDNTICLEELDKNILAELQQSIISSINAGECSIIWAKSCLKNKSDIRPLVRCLRILGYTVTLHPLMIEISWF